MQRFILFIFTVVIIVSCKDIDKPKKPDNLISKNKMIDVITDISLVHAAKGTNKKLIEGNNINPENYIFNKYNIDSLQFAESNNYYAYDVKEYEDIYLKVKQRLQKKKKELKATLDEERKEKDSIRGFRKKANDSLKKLNPLKKSSKTFYREEIDGKKIK